MMRNKFIILFIFIFIIFCIYTILINIYPKKYIEIIDKNTTIIDNFLVLSVIKAESNFNKNIVSKKDAKGLMQIRDITASEYEYTDLFNEEDNIKIGVKYLEKLYIKYDKTITNNFNLDNIDKIPFLETKNYIKKVINSYKIYKILY
ncbi:MAG: transglycosylase SLT domain-containing protein [Clostridia bacterium]